ncbi:hypothetical protein BH24DEI1_BH24DEI1_01240 [soil metagenome]|jgi:hypothetical protein|nr:hypothetical protein [Deinococcota bacterium]
MTTKELMQNEIAKLGDKDIDELYALIKAFVQAKQKTAEPSLMSSLKNIKIAAPQDFASNLDAYVSGEKCIEDSR